MIGSPLTSFCHSEVWQADRQQRSTQNALPEFSILNSPPLQGFLASPTPIKERPDLTVMSPADSNLMFSLPHSPSNPQKAFEMLAKQDNDLLMSTFSPSIFSPPDKRVLSRNKLESGFSSSGMYIDSPDIFNLDDDRGEEDETLLNESDINTENDSDESFSMGSTPVKSSPAKMALKFTKLNVKRTSNVEGANSRKKSPKFNSFVTPDNVNSSLLISPDNHNSISRKLSITSNQGSIQSTNTNNSKKNSTRNVRDTPRQRHLDTSFSQDGTDDVDQEEHDDQEEDDDDDDENASSSNSVKSSKSNTKSSNNNNNNNSIVSCNCKKSKCLKLYCDCFAILRHCDSRYCRCVSCCNTVSHETLRNNAIKTIKERNSRAFRLKINEEEHQHVSGCHCKNSRCLKKYCECFTANALCGANCKCLSCDNYNGSEELLKIRKLSPATPSSSVLHTPSPSAAATAPPSASSVTGTVSSLSSSAVSSSSNSNNNNNNSSSKKRKDSPNSVAALLDNSPSLSHTSANTSTTNSNNKAVFSSSSSHFNNNMQHVQQAPPLKKHATHLTPNSQHNNSHNSSLIIQSQQAAGLAMLTTPTSSQHLLVPVKVTTRSSATRQQNQPIATQNDAFDEPLQRPSQHTSSNTSSPDSSISSVAGRTRAKNKRVRFATTVPVTYPFFGPQLPQTSKFIALKCLDYLSCSDLYTMSTVNSLWCSAATDEALWE